MGIKVYLSGPMLGCDTELMKKWRNHVKEELKNTNYVFIDPTNLHYDNEAEHADEVVAYAERCVMEADIILAYIPFYSMGTSCEILWAAQQNKEIIAVLIVKDESAFVYKYADSIFHDLDTAIQYLRDRDVLKNRG